MLSDFILMPENNFSNYALDTIWNMQMVIKGEMIRVPEILYHKRYLGHDGSLHYHWGKFTGVEKTKALLEHHKDCLKLILRTDFEQEELVRLIEASKSRFLPELWDLNEKERASFVETLLERTIIVLDDSKNKNPPQFLKQI